MGNIQVKNLPEELHRELKRRAKLRGQTVRDYLLDLIRRDQSLPTKEEWLARLKERKPINPPVSGADLIREGREERGDHLFRVHVENQARR